MHASDTDLFLATKICYLGLHKPRETSRDKNNDLKTCLRAPSWFFVMLCYLIFFENFILDFYYYSLQRRTRMGEPIPGKQVF